LERCKLIFSFEIGFWALKLILELEIDFGGYFFA